MRSDLLTPNPRPNLKHEFAVPKIISNATTMMHDVISTWLPQQPVTKDGVS